MLRSDPILNQEINRRHLLLQTALMVIVIGVGLGIFADGLGFNSAFPSSSGEFSGFKTVNITHYKR